MSGETYDSRRHGGGKRLSQILTCHMIHPFALLRLIGPSIGASREKNIMALFEGTSEYLDFFFVPLLPTCGRD